MCVAELVGLVELDPPYVYFPRLRLLDAAEHCVPFDIAKSAAFRSFAES